MIITCVKEKLDKKNIYDNKKQIITLFYLFLLKYRFYFPRQFFQEKRKDREQKDTNIREKQIFYYNPLYDCQFNIFLKWIFNGPTYKLNRNKTIGISYKITLLINCTVYGIRTFLELTFLCSPSISNNSFSVKIEHRPK